MPFRPTHLLVAVSVLALASATACKSDSPVTPGGDGAPIGKPRGLLSLGEVVMLNVNGLQSCSNATLHPARVVAIGQKSIIFADTLNPRNGFATTDYQRFAARFDTLVYPLIVENFGQPTDIDENGGRIAIVFTRAVNELTAANSGSFVGGFAYSRDLFPVVASSRAQACAASNEGEYFYALAPDPTGSINSNVRTTAFVDSVTTAVLAHELEHIINSSRRLYITNAKGFEEKWLDEGLAHIAEELLFYREAKLGPRMNLDITAIRATAAIRNAYNSDMAGNAARYRSYLQEPAINSPYALDDSLPTRGAAWSFLRYMVDRVNAADGFGPGNGQRVNGQGSVTLTAGSTPQEYSGSVTNTTAIAGGPAASFALAITAPGIAATQPIAAPVQSVVPIPVEGQPEGLRTARNFESGLRTRERVDLTPRFAAARRWYASQHADAAVSSASRASMSSSIANADATVWMKLVNNDAVGIENLRTVTGADIGAFVRDWAVSNAVDDVAELSTQFQQRSWNWRSIYPNLGAGGGQYPLKVQTISTGANVSSSAVAGGTAYYRILVPSNSTLTVSLTPAAGNVLPTLQLVLVRTK